MSQHNINPNYWVQLHSDYLYNFAVSKIDNQELAKDLVSETFLAGLKSMANFKGQSSERTWLVAILKRKIIDQYRKKNSKKGKAEVRMTYNSEENESDWLEENAPDIYEKTPQEAIENTELGIAIHNCIDKLSHKQATVFKLKTIFNYNTELICKELKISSSNLWVTIHRARNMIADCMEEKWFKK